MLLQQVVRNLRAESDPDLSVHNPITLATSRSVFCTGPLAISTEVVVVLYRPAPHPKPALPSCGRPTRAVRVPTILGGRFPSMASAAKPCHVVENGFPLKTDLVEAT